MMARTSSWHRGFAHPRRVTPNQIGLELLPFRSGGITTSARPPETRGDPVDLFVSLQQGLHEVPGVDRMASRAAVKDDPNRGSRATRASSSRERSHPVSSRGSWDTGRCSCSPFLFHLASISLPAAKISDAGPRPLPQRSGTGVSERDASDDPQPTKNPIGEDGMHLRVPVAALLAWPWPRVPG